MSPLPDSEWVRREVNRADINHTSIIPLLFDDTQIQIIQLQTVQYIDFRTGFSQAFKQLTSRLNSLIEDTENLSSASSGFTWKPLSRLTLRSQFLEDNSYINRNDPNFAQTDWTKRLIQGPGLSQDMKADHFTTLVATPVPHAIDADPIDSATVLGLDKSAFANFGETDENHHEFRFSISGLDGKRTTQTEFIRYMQHRCTKVFRLSQDGSVELGMSYPSVILTTIEKYCFNFIYTVGAAWKFVHLVSNLYHSLNYTDDFQLLLNLCNTSNTVLAEFAQDRNRQQIWPDVLSIDAFTGKPQLESDEGIAIDQNLQFVCDVNVGSMIKNPTQSGDLMIYLSRKLQTSFNYEYEERHFIRGTEKFPWHQYDHWDHWLQT